MSRRRASATSGRSPGTPGFFTSTSTPSRSEMSSSFPSERSTWTTSSPRAASAAAAASPERARPYTSARIRLSNAEVEVVAVEECEADRAEDPRDDPEADHDLRLGPRLHLEVVVDRRHQENASAEVLEREDL